MHHYEKEEPGADDQDRSDLRRVALRRNRSHCDGVLLIVYFSDQ